MTVTYDTAVGLLAERLAERALEHCLRVAETAAAIAGIYGLDAEEARLAGLLHDWDRDLEHEELVAAAERYDLQDHGEEFRTAALLHAHTAARALADQFPGIPADVVRAVERHTLGAPDMQALDMVVYVADMVEPGRAYPGVNDLREMVGTVSLGDLFGEAFRQTVLHLVNERKHIHPVTVAVWNTHVARRQS